MLGSVSWLIPVWPACCVLQEFLQHVVDTEITASKLVWNTLLELWLRAFTVLDAGEGASDAGASAIVRQCCMRVC